MKSARKFTTYAMAVLLVLALCGPDIALAQSQAQPQSQNVPVQPGTTNVDPTQGPIAPEPQPAETETLPDAPSASQPQQPATAPQQATTQQAQPQNQREPLGTAAAEKGRTAGGAASKPAGAAIAPAKQRQVRSLLIKLGAIAGAGLAIGTVYMLSRGTSSTPPGATTTTNTPAR